MSIGGRIALLLHYRDTNLPPRRISRNYFAHNCYTAVFRSARMHVTWFVHRVRRSKITSSRFKRISFLHEVAISCSPIRGINKIITPGGNHGSGHFYLAQNRSFLLCVDTAGLLRNPRIRQRSVRPGYWGHRGASAIRTWLWRNGTAARGGDRADTDRGACAVREL